MSSFLSGFLFASLAGLLMAVQGSINSVLGKKVGLWEANLIVHVTGVFVLVLILFLLRVGSSGFHKLSQAPWYTFLGGLLGVMIIYGVTVSIPKLGVAIATTAIVVAQVSTALVIDHFGLFGLEEVPFSWLKALGLVFLAIGTRLMLLK
ncbi:MAG: DMT family transporter [Halanaerobium sp.]|nr:DMT family transporter [Halanaerobium sp.]